MKMTQKEKIDDSLHDIYKDFIEAVEEAGTHAHYDGCDDVEFSMETFEHHSKKWRDVLGSLSAKLKTAEDFRAFNIETYRSIKE